MGSGAVGNYQGTSGSISNFVKEQSLISDSQPIKKGKSYSQKGKVFDSKGTVTLESISDNREVFLNKSANQIAEFISQEGGYKTIERKSIHKGSNARILEITNSSKDRNISQIQVSPGSQRHGDVPYVKISTTNIGKIKIIDAPKSKYVNDGKEKATLLFRRNNK